MSKFDWVQVKSEPRIKLATGASRIDPRGKGRFDLLSPWATRDLARHFEAGAALHGERNWEKGMPFSRLVSSAMRHLDQFRMGLTDEDHLSAARWQLHVLAHFRALGRTELNDLPWGKGGVR